MFAHPAFFILALALLWFPRQWMRLGSPLWRRKRVRRTQEPWRQREPGDPRMSFWEEFGKARNWFDLLRATTGSLAIFGGDVIEPSIEPISGVPRSGLLVLAIQFAVVLIGLLIQTARKERGRGTFFAPVFYLAGLAVGLCGGWAAIFAFILVWAVNPMLGNTAAFLMVQGLTLLAFGFLMRGVGNVQPLLACLLCLTPALLSMLLRRPLVVFSRKAPTSDKEDA